MKHIHWLVPYKISNPEDIFKMNLASARLRSGLFFSPAFKKFSVNLNESISNLKSIDILLVGKFPENRQDLYKTLY